MNVFTLHVKYRFSIRAVFCCLEGHRYGLVDDLFCTMITADCFQEFGLCHNRSPLDILDSSNDTTL